VNKFTLEARFKTYILKHLGFEEANNRHLSGAGLRWIVVHRKFFVFADQTFNQTFVVPSSSVFGLKI